MSLLRRGKPNHKDKQGGKENGMIQAAQEAHLDRENRSILHDEQFEYIYVPALAQRLAIYKKKFMEFDRDLSGDINFSEFKRLLECIDETKTRLKSKKLFKRCGKIERGIKGVITYRNFVDMLLGDTLGVGIMFKEEQEVVETIERKRNEKIPKRTKHRPPATAPPQQEVFEHESSTQEEEHSDRYESDRTSSGRTSSDEYVSDMMSSGRRSNDRHESDRASSGRRSNDRHESDRASSGRKTSERYVSDMMSSGRTPSERNENDRASSGRTSSERYVSDMMSSGRTSSDRASSNRTSTDIASSDGTEEEEVIEYYEEVVEDGQHSEDGSIIAEQVYTYQDSLPSYTSAMDRQEAGHGEEDEGETVYEVEEVEEEDGEGVYEEEEIPAEDEEEEEEEVCIEMKIGDFQ